MSSETTVLLHIGTPKTGTTSLQKFLMDNARALQKRGVDYPTDERIFWHWAHHPLGAVLSKPYARWVDASYNRPPQEAFAPLREHIEKTRAHTVLLSSEQFFLAKNLKQLPSLLPGVRIRVLCYFRWQVEFLRSWFRQAIVAGGNFWQLDESNFERFIKRWTESLDHYETASELARIFGKENLALRIFERDCLRDGDIVSDVLEALDLPADLAQRGRDSRAIEVNTAVSGDLLELKAHSLTKRWWKGDLKRMRRFSRALEHDLQRLSTGSTHSAALEASFGRELRDRVRARYEDSNRRFLAEFAPPRASLPREEGAATAPRPTEIDLERMAELLVVSWQAQDQRIQELEAQLGTGGS